jgi:hypothetical protein
MARPQLLSGARGQLKINSGTAIAYVTDVNVNVQANVRAVHTFGAPHARSVEPLSTGVTLSIGKVIPMNNVDGTKKVNTSNIAMGIEAVIQNMLTAEDITVTLMDSVTDQVVADVRNCRFAGSTLGLSAQQIAQGRINLVGIYDAAGGNTPNDIGL